MRGDVYKRQVLDTARQLKMADSLGVYVGQAAYYSFERQAYQLTGDDLTVENLNAIYSQVAQDFGFDSVGWDEAGWTEITHFFTNPFYVISYVVSNDGAMQLYQMEMCIRDRYMAFHEGTPIAGTLAIWFGDKVWYLYGASSNHHRNLMPNYLLQWNMIQWALEKKCRIYDFRGVSGDLSEDNPLYGLYKFKKGFNGEFTEFVGEMDLILSKPLYVMIDKATKLYQHRNVLKYRRENRDLSLIHI